MNDHGPLHDRVLEALRTDMLPGRSADRVSGGLGPGGPCAICGGRVNADELELELEFATGGERPDTYTVHLACYSAWKSKRRELESSRATMTVKELSDTAGDIKFALDERQASREQGEA